jgi:large subunit ribosomal protein L4
MELKVVNIKGAETGKTVKLEQSIFGIEPNDHAIYLDVKQILANKRQGTHKTKSKGEITGSTRKLKKQKGTGGARAGSIKSPLFRGGGRVFGPQPRSYSIKLNQKVKQLARRSALTYKVQNNNLTIIEDFDFPSPKTKQIVELSANLKLSDKKTLLVVPDINKNIYLSSRNLQGFDVIIASDLNTYDILRAQNIVILEGSLAVIEGILKN